MTIFKSVREKRFWLWALVVLVGIYSTLFLSGILTKLLYNQNFSAFVFLMVIALIAVSIFTRGIKIPKTFGEIWVWIGIAAVYGMFFLRLTLLERSHLMEYSVLAILIHEALKERASHGDRKLSPALLAIVITFLLGVIDECLQLFIPNRYFDPIDIVFNGLAVLMAIGSSMILTWVRKRMGKSRLNR